jgi:hypothetical protein
MNLHYSRGEMPGGNNTSILAVALCKSTFFSFVNLRKERLLMVFLNHVFICNPFLPSSCVFTVYVFLHKGQVVSPPVFDMGVLLSLSPGE